MSLNEFTYFHCFLLCVMRFPEELGQEIWPDQMSNHHDNLMIGLGENGKGMVTEIWS